MKVGTVLVLDFKIPSDLTKAKILIGVQFTMCRTQIVFSTSLEGKYLVKISMWCVRGNRMMDNKQLFHQSMIIHKICYRKGCLHLFYSTKFCKQQLVLALFNASFSHWISLSVTDWANVGAGLLVSIKWGKIFVDFAQLNLILSMSIHSCKSCVHVKSWDFCRLKFNEVQHLK